MSRHKTHFVTVIDWKLNVKMEILKLLQNNFEPITFRKIHRMLCGEVGSFTTLQQILKEMMNDKLIQRDNLKKYSKL